MSNDIMPKKYDLEERTGEFGKDIIGLAKKVSRNIVTASSVSQIVRAGASVGSNYCEADCAESRKDFERKLGKRSQKDKTLVENDCESCSGPDIRNSEIGKRG